MKYLALSQMCSIFASLVPMHAVLLQRSVQESTKKMASLLAFKNACIFVLKEGCNASEYQVASCTKISDCEHIKIKCVCCEQIGDGRDRGKCNFREELSVSEPGVRRVCADHTPSLQLPHEHQ